MDTERRAAPRHPASVYFNKYIDGRPYAAEVLELSVSGMLVRKIHEPDAPRACYALELAPNGAAFRLGSASAGADPVWLCGTPVWSSGSLEALGFVGQSPADRARLMALIEQLPR